MRNGRHLAQVGGVCSSLETLDLSSWLGLTDAGLARAISMGNLATLRRLFVSQCPGVGDGSLRAILDGCLALEELSAGGCDRVRQC